MARPATCFYWTARSCFATDVGGKRTILVKGPKTKANRELALRKLAELLATLPTKPVVSPKLTVAELVDWFLAHCRDRCAAGEIKPHTLASYTAYGRLVRQECGHWLANQINDDRVRGYRRRLQTRDLSPTTVKNRLGTLRAVLRWANGRYVHIDVHINTGSARRREHIPTHDEIKKLLAAARPDVCDVLTTIINCPVRPGDCFALRRRSVDVAAGLFRLPDSNCGQRLVPIGQIPVVTEVLERRLVAAIGDNDFVFTTVTGSPWNFRYFGQLVRKARADAGLGKHVVAYACRHYWTTTALLNNVPLETVAALRGDKDIRTTMIYEHVSQHLSHLQQAARQAVGLPDATGSDSPEDHSDES